MEKKRFFYSHSSVYGWCVYDREYGSPAYMACAGLLPPVTVNEDDAVDESLVLLESEYKAMRLCSRLNLVWKKVSKK